MDKKDIHPRANGPKGVNAQYLSPTPGEIPIVACKFYPDGYSPVPLDFEWVRECGFNAVTPYAKDLAKVFELSKGSGVKIVVPQETWVNKDFIDSVVAKYKDDPSLGAWGLIDEPIYKAWHPDDKNEYCDAVDSESRYPGDLCELYDQVLATDPRHMVYINLAVTDHEKNKRCFMGEHKSQMEYLSEFQDVFHPGVWSYDFYPTREWSDGGVWVLRTQYYEFYYYLKCFSDISKATNRPFWAYCESAQCCNKVWRIPEPTIPMLRFQAFGALAFGAKGIFYWYYAERNVVDCKFVNAPVKIDNNKATQGRKKTTIWHNVKAVNDEIHKYARVFLYTETVGIFRSSEKFSINTQMPDINVWIPEVRLPYGPLSSITVSISTENTPSAKPKGVIISHLRLGDRNYLVFASRSMEESQHITLDFNYEHTVRLTGCGGSELSGSSMEPDDGILDGEYSWIIEPGGYVIVEWDERAQANPYISPTPGEIPLICYATNASDVKGLAEQGINTVACEADSIESMLEDAGASGIRLIVSKGEMDNNGYMTCIRKHMTNSRIGAWMPADCPTFDMLAANGEGSFHDLYDEILEWDPLHMAFPDLMTSSDSSYIGKYRTYRDYLQWVNDSFNPAVWSYRFNILSSKATGELDYSGFFRYLHDFSYIANESGKKFWHGCTVTDNPAMASKGINALRFEIITALVFGAKGVLYRVGDNMASKEAIGKINSEIRKYSNVFCNSESISVFTQGEPYYGMNPLGENSYGPLMRLMITSGSSVTVGHLKRGYSNYLVFIGKSATENAGFFVRFNPDMFVLKGYGEGILSQTPPQKPTNTFAEDSEWVLQPGGYVIFEWDERDSNPEVL